MSRKQKPRLIDGLRLSGIHSAGRAFGKVGVRPIYVDFAIPGELVNVSIPRHYKGYVVGTLENITDISEYRQVPFCKHFGECGGCSWQHIEYRYQLGLKARILSEALAKYEIATPAISSATASPSQCYYRNKLEYAFSSNTDTIAEEQAREGGVLGFHPYSTFKQVVSIEKCFLQPDPSRKVAAVAHAIARETELAFYNQQNGAGDIRSLTIRTSSTGELMLIVGFSTADTNIIEAYLAKLFSRAPEITSLYYCTLSGFDASYVTGNLTLYKGDKYINEKLNGQTFRVNPKSFFQPNVQQAEAIFNTIIRQADLRSSDLVYDLYTGVGSIACHIAGSARQVVGIEGSAEAIADAEYNALQNGITNATFMVGDILKTFTPGFVEQYGKPDVVILDPPRSGTLIEIKRTILQAAPRLIIYLSCNPVSLAFDLKMLTQGYRIAYIQPFDMFPQTHHVETLVILEKKS